MNGFNMTMRGERQQNRNTFTFNPSLELPDIVGMYYYKLPATCSSL
jgi:hypothetical protein